MLAIDGTVMVRVTTEPILSLMLSGNHQESVQLFVIPSPLLPGGSGLSMVETA